MSSIFSKRPGAVFRLRAVDLDSWNMALDVRAMRTCIFMLRKDFGCLKILMLTFYRGPDPNEVQKAKELCEDLLKNVREQYEEFKTRPPQRGYGTSTGYGGERGYGDRAPDRSNSYGGGVGGGYGGYSNAPAPNTPGTPAAPGARSPPGAAGADYAAQYAQYYGAAGAGGADPYAAYGKLNISLTAAFTNFLGGYAAYVQYYQQYMAAAAAAQQQSPPPGAPGSGSAPPPPPSENPPPPPSGSPPGNGYNNVSSDANLTINLRFSKP